MKKSITILVHNLFFMGGTTRAVSNTANMLSEKGHSVTILSTFRSQKDPYFPLNKKIKVKSIIDYTSENKRRLIHILFNRLNHFFYPIFKSKHIHLDEPGIRQFSRFIEKKMIREIQQVDTDILISTRASYNLLVAEYASKNVKIIAQEHMVYSMHSERLQDSIQKNYNKFDYVTTLTNKDAIDYQQFLNPDKVFSIPNILSNEYLNRVNVSRKNIILAAGRFEAEKGFDLLIEAIHLNHTLLREWEVHIYGNGQQKELLTKLIDNYHLNDTIKLYPPTSHLYKKMNEASLFVLPSRFEGFGMVIIEAMASRLPVIAFNCPIGPSTIINDTNGILVENGNVEQLSNEIAKLVADSNLRTTYANEGLITSKQYIAENVYSLWEKLLN